jgi:hypothetical protein
VTRANGAAEVEQMDAVALEASAKADTACRAKTPLHAA